MEQTKIGQLLQDAGLVEPDQLERALEQQARTGHRLGSTLVAMGIIDEDSLAAQLSIQTGFPCVELKNVIPSPQILEMIPAEVSRRTSSIPVKRIDDALHVAMTDPTDVRALEELESATGLRIVPMIAPSTTLNRALETYYPARPRSRRGPRTPPRQSEIEAEFRTIEKGLATLAEALERLRRKVLED